MLLTPRARNDSTALRAAESRMSLVRFLKASPNKATVLWLKLKPASCSARSAAGRRSSNPGVGAPQASRAVETAPAPSGKAGAPGVGKTLKCGECGTLNRPTEWYCERCGAELAGI